MKHAKINMAAMVALLLVGMSGAAAQSLGDYAKNVRKSKTDAVPASRHFDNDNLPTSDGLSVVGPVPAADGQAAATATTAKSADVDANAAAADRQKAADEWKDKLEKQQAKIDSLNHELDLDQRELRLRAAAVYSDPAVRGRDAANWDKQDAQYRSDIESKQKAIDDARQQLEDLQEQARKAGIKQNDNDTGTDKNKK
jgi:hypothetical protein